MVHYQSIIRTNNKRLTNPANRSSNQEASTDEATTSVVIQDTSHIRFIEDTIYVHRSSCQEAT